MALFPTRLVAHAWLIETQQLSHIEQILNEAIVELCSNPSSSSNLYKNCATLGTLVYSLTTEVWGQCMVKFSFIFSFFIPAFKSEYNIQSSDFILVCNKFQYSYYISISNTEIWNVS